MIDQIIETWQELKQGECSSYKLKSLRWNVDNGCTVGLAVDSKGYPGIYVDTPRAQKVREYANLSIHSDQTRDGRHRLYVILKDVELEPELAQLCTYLIDSIDDKSYAVGSGWVRKQLERWATLVKRRVHKITAEMERGLWAELEILTRVLQSQTPERAVFAWKGPEEDHQDFHFENERLEVKTTFGKKGSIHISSLDQLDAAGKLILVVVDLATHDNGLTLKEKVDAVRKLVKDSPLALSEFNDKLDMVGYNETMKQVGSDSRYEATDTHWYDASGLDFPCLRRSLLPSPTILNASYDLSVAGIEKFTCSALF